MVNKPRTHRHRLKGPPMKDRVLTESHDSPSRGPLHQKCFEQTNLELETEGTSSHNRNMDTLTAASRDTTFGTAASLAK